MLKKYYNRKGEKNFSHTAVNFTFLSICYESLHILYYIVFFYFLSSSNYLVHAGPL